MDQSNFIRVRPEPTVQQLQSLVAELLTALRGTLGDERDGAELSLRRAAAVLQTVGAPARKGGLAPWQMSKVAAHIEAHLDRPLRSRDLAALVRLTPAHFSRTFRASFGCSPLEFVIRRRMERAQRLMLSTDTPLSQIALDCGLADQAHLSRLFRRVVGESPRVWRRARHRRREHVGMSASAVAGGSMTA